ncbi:MAG TPA: hypothetical protein VKK79_14800 [Candidatus Lokiarchaeia archaeon]|nr:hypothetical protein [Candidatus Lokiarchaeia archaeon]
MFGVFVGTGNGGSEAPYVLLSSVMLFSKCMACNMLALCVVAFRGK